MSAPRTAWCLALAACTLAPVTPVQAGWLDDLFGKSGTAAPAPQQASPTRRVWELGDFTVVRRAPREPGGPANQHPATVQDETLRQLLGSLKFSQRDRSETLFGSNELGELVGPLSQALSLAEPGDDVLLLSTSRRGEGFLTPPTALTARLFVQDGRLQVIVREARQDFYNTYRGTQVAPVFVYGSRTVAGSVTLTAPQPAQLARTDWVSLPLVAPRPMAEMPAAPSPAVAPATAPVAPAVAAVSAPATAPAAAPARPRDEKHYAEQELRLRNLLRLREAGLITEEEFQQKRREVLQQL